MAPEEAMTILSGPQPMRWDAKDPLGLTEHSNFLRVLVKQVCDGTPPPVNKTRQKILIKLG